MMNFPDLTSRIQPIFTKNSIQLDILREDELHPQISGNKFRKLKYNVQAFQQGSFSALLTFGGAYSNHISATAAAGKAFNLPTIGLIRGEELANKIDQNPTLSFAQSCDMQLEFISREAYREKSTPAFIQQLEQRFGKFYMLPEGGTNALAIQGCEEILDETTQNYDYICVAVGTAGTISGILNASEKHQKVIGFPALKSSDFLKKEILTWTKNEHFELINGYHFGGYGKINEDLVQFINQFKQDYHVPLDPIYTGKMMFGIWDLIKKDYFAPHSRILAIHTGGLQGIEGMNQELLKKNKTIIA